MSRTFNQLRALYCEKRCLRDVSSHGPNASVGRQISRGRPSSILRVRAYERRPGGEVEAVA